MKKIILFLKKKLISLIETNRNRIYEYRKVSNMNVQMLDESFLKSHHQVALKKTMVAIFICIQSLTNWQCHLQYCYLVPGIKIAVMTEVNKERLLTKFVTEFLGFEDIEGVIQCKFCDKAKIIIAQPVWLWWTNSFSW